MERRLTSNWPTLEQQKDLTRGAYYPPGLLQFDVARGTQPTDVLWSNSVHPMFISARLMALLVEHQITGWATYPVELFDRKGQHLPGYHGFAITGAMCERDRSRSQVIEKPPVVPNGQPYQVYRGLYFIESQWDGNDMFWVQHGGKVVTERVYRLFRKHKIVNARFTPLSEVERRVSDDKYSQS